MARWKNYLGSAKALGASSSATLIWTGNDLPTPAPGSSLVAIHIATAATTGGQTIDITQFTNLRIKANGNIIYDLTTTELRSWLARFTPSNLAYGSSNAAFTIPFNLFDLFDDDQADQCGFPLRTVPTVELTAGGSTNAGNVYIGWTLSTVTPSVYPVLLKQQMNIAASPNNASFPFVENGQIRALGLDTTNLSRCRITVNGFDYVTLPGAKADSGSGTIGDMFRDAESFEQDTTFTKPIFHRLPMIPAAQGLSRVEISGGSGVATTDSLTMWAVRPQ